MAAGGSADAEARRQFALVESYRTAMLEAQATAGRYLIAARTERHTARTLAPLAGIGYHLLPDRRWPGARRAQVDLVVVGPGGVFIVDTKAWAEVRIERDRIFRGDADVTDEFDSLESLVDVVQADMAEIGLAPGEVRALVVLAGRSGINAHVGAVHVVGERDALAAITSHGARIPEGRIDEVIRRTLDLFPQVNAPAPLTTTVPEPVIATSPHEQEPLLTDEEVDEALLAGVMARPIEDWMVFLHPAQAKLVRRSFNGPSRVRGPAGTGKTVVGLHRAAHLARTKQGRILVTTYVRSLPQVQRTLLARLAPEVADRVEFTGVHAFARRLLAERGVRIKLDPDAERRAFHEAWASVGSRSRLSKLALGETYWADEIRYVLKGRGITDFDAYAALNRTGRRHRLDQDTRREVWRLYGAYDQALRKRGVHDWADLILLATKELRREPLTGYGAVIVDEAQDLSCSMIQLLHTIVGDAPDGLTLIGDGQQSIYPGGYTLAEAGVSVANRGVLLDINYRNTAQIAAFAQRHVDGDEYADIEGVVGKGDVPSSIPRTGPEPVVFRAGSWSEINAATVARVREVTAEVGTGLADVAVLCPSRASVEAVTTVLNRAGLATMPLDDYAGQPDAAVKVGTIKRAKGLEFKHVLLPDFPHEAAVLQQPDDPAAVERWALDRRELYVAMTRARDGLWLAIRA